MKTFKLPKLILTDIDGVWTDGGMYYYNDVEEGKKFNVRDGVGALLLKSAGIPWGIVTGEKSNLIQKRAIKLKCDILLMGVKNKIQAAENLAKDMEIKLSDIAFVGDEINDVTLLSKVGFSASPSDACSYVKKHVDVTLKRKGGEGVFKEFVELILLNGAILDTTRERALTSFQET